MQTTACPLEILIGLEQCDDMRQTRDIVENLRPLASVRGGPTTLQVFENSERLGFVRNINALIARSSGAYVAVMPHDDIIGVDFYEKLRLCLDANPQAVNCYPFLVFDQVGNKYRHRLDQTPSKGSADMRVHQALNTDIGASFRGLVRFDRRFGFHEHPMLMRPHPHDFFIADLAQIVQLSTFGEIIPADVLYAKRIRPQSLMNQQVHNQDVYTLQHQKDALIAYGETCFNAAHMFTKSSESFLSDVRQRVNKRFMSEVRRFRDVDRDLSSELLAKIATGKRVIVLGAGLQGALVALGFRARGFDVTLIDKESDVLTRAAVTNEGKLHLGFVYSKDNTMRTADLMLEHALHFADAAEQLLGQKVDWEALKSTAFNYLVPFMSFLSADELDRFFARVQERYDAMLAADPRLNYLGKRPTRLYQRVPLPLSVNSSFFQAMFRTEEFAIAPIAFAKIVRKALYQRNVRMSLVSK